MTLANREVQTGPRIEIRIGRQPTKVQLQQLLSMILTGVHDPAADEQATQGLYPASPASKAEHDEFAEQPLHLKPQEFSGWRTLFRR